MTSKSEFCRLAERFPAAPLVASIDLQPNEVIQAFSRLRARPYPFLLDSARGGRFTFFGAEPWGILRAKGDRWEWCEDGRRSSGTGDPVEVLRGLLARYRGPSLSPDIPFAGGAVGYFGYEIGRWFERLPGNALDDLLLPDLVFVFTSYVVVFDNVSDTAYLVVTPLEGGRKGYDRGLRTAERVADLLYSGGPSGPRSCEVGEPTSNFTKSAYAEMVSRCKDYIAAGDIIQANLSQRLEAAFVGDPFDLYLRLRQINPSPMAFFFDFGEVALASCSPERLVEVRGRMVETRPIAGTRPRGETSEQDETLRADLVLSEKERAEHVMLADLARNDLGRVCEYGSVQVDKLMTVEDYSHVFHIVSHIRGRLRPECDRFDLLRSVFPGGTITGAPKIRCMEIIDELEPVARGPYTGSAGYLGYDGDMDLNIIIRTFVLSGGKAYVQVGGGVVADSDPEAEYHETLYKAEALLVALEEARRSQVTST